MKNTIAVCAVAVVAIFALCYAMRPPRDLILNGGFELQDIPEAKVIQTNRIPGWTVEGGSVGLLRLKTNTVVMFDKSSGRLKQTVRAGVGVRYIAQHLVRRKRGTQQETFLQISVFRGDEHRLSVDFSPPPDQLATGWVYVLDNCSLYRVSDSDVGARLLSARPAEVRFE